MLGISGRQIGRLIRSNIPYATKTAKPGSVQRTASFGTLPRITHSSHSKSHLCRSAEAVPKPDPLPHHEKAPVSGAFSLLLKKMEPQRGISAVLREYRCTDEEADTLTENAIR